MEKWAKRPYSPVQPIWPVFSYQLRHPTSPLCRYLFENLLFCDWFIQKFIGMLAFSLSPSTLILDPTTRWQLMTYTNHLLLAARAPCRRARAERGGLKHAAVAAAAEPTNSIRFRTGIVDPLLSLTLSEMNFNSSAKVVEML